MKKLLMLTCIALFIQQADAQYFWRYYGNMQTQEFNEQFIPCTPPTVAPFPPGGPGYVMVGRYFDPSVAPVVNELHMVHTNNIGVVGVGAPFFNRHYRLTDCNSQQVCDAWATSVDELPGIVAGTFDYVVAGNITVPATPTNPAQVNFFVLRMNAAGVINWIFRYSFPNFDFRDPKLKMDFNRNNILITGIANDLNNPGNLRDVFAFSIIPANGGINWGMTYDLKPFPGGPSYDDVAKDIIENNWAPATAPEVIIVGASSNDGLFLKVTAGAGLPVAATRYNLPGSVSQILNCINYSTNPLNTTPFIVGGSVLWPGVPQNDAWAMLIDQFGVPTWSTTHDTGLPGAPLDNTLNEITERFNMNPMPAVYEYYTSGTIVNPLAVNPANTDIQALKLGANGGLIAEFIYGAPTDQEEGKDIHCALPVMPFPNNGFVLSGNTSLRANDQLLIKAYFNGVIQPVAQCPYVVNTFYQVRTYPNINYPHVDYYTDTVKDCVDTVSLPVTMATCFNVAAVAGGSNLKVAPKQTQPKDDDGLNFTVVGNGEEGISTGSEIHLLVKNGDVRNMKVRIIDLLGREYPCYITGAMDGVIGLTTALPKSGTYYIVLFNGTETKSKALFVK